MQCFTRAAEFCDGGQPCQGLLPPRATWPSRSGPADTVRPEFAANTALMYAADQPGATDRQQAAAQEGACSRTRHAPALIRQLAAAEKRHHHLLFQAAEALRQALDQPAGSACWSNCGKSLGESWWQGVCRGRGQQVTGCRSKCQERRRWWAVRPGLAPLYNRGLLLRVLLASNKTRPDEGVLVKLQTFHIRPTSKKIYQ